MAWYDYIPGVSNIHGLMQGKPAQALAGPVGYALSKPGEDAAGNAANAQGASLDSAMQRLQSGSAQQYQNRMKDLEATMNFYGPAQRYLESIYGGGASGPKPLAPGPPGMGGAMPPPPGFPKPQGPPTVQGFGQGPRRGF